MPPLPEPPVPQSPDTAAVMHYLLNLQDRICAGLAEEGRRRLLPRGRLETP